MILHRVAARNVDSSRTQKLVGKIIGFLARLEEDPECPDNKAHANFYNGNVPTQRKKMAAALIKKIVDSGGILVEPTFS